MSVSVFISYRRAPAAFIARAMYQDLRAHGYDAFLDVQSIDSGTFTAIIERQIYTRDYFVVILSPDTLNRCQQTDDLVRREIEIAFTSQRVIVPFVMETFDWGDVTRYLPPHLHPLAQMNSVPKVSHEWFEAAMDRLRTRHLKPLADLADAQEEVRVSRSGYATPTPMPAPAAPPAAIPVPPDNAMSPYPDTGSEAALSQSLIQKTDAASLPTVTVEEMWAEASVQQASVLRQAERYDEALTLLDAVIARQPDYASAWLQRGLVRLGQDDHAGSLTDFDAALARTPSADAYGGKGIALMSLNEWSQAAFELTMGLAAFPNDAGLLFLQAHLLHQRGQLKEAVTVMKRVLMLNPHYPTAQDTLADWKASRGGRGLLD